MGFPSAEPRPTNWIDLPDTEKLALIPYFDNSTRRALRCCSRKTKALVENSAHISKLQIVCTRDFRRDGIWYCAYKDPNHRGPSHREFFESREEAYGRMRELIRTAEIITYLEIYMDPGAICSLVDGSRLLIHVEALQLYIAHQLDELIYLSYLQILRQVKPNRLEAFYLEVRELPIHQQNLIRDQFLELERTIFSRIQEIAFDCSLNDQHMLELRIPDIILGNAGAITHTAVFTLAQRMILQTTPRTSFNLLSISDDLQMYFFGRLLRGGNRDPVYLIMNSVQPDLKVVFAFLVSGEFRNEEMEYTVEILMRSNNVNEIFERYGPIQANNNFQTMRAFPNLTRFLIDISVAIPRFLNLLCNLPFLPPVEV